MSKIDDEFIQYINDIHALRVDPEEANAILNTRNLEDKENRENHITLIEAFRAKIAEADITEILETSDSGSGNKLDNPVTNRTLLAHLQLDDL